MLRSIKDIEVIENANLKGLNTYKVESTTKYLIKVKTESALVELLKYLKGNNIDYYILGAGSNVILGKFFDGAVIKLTGFDHIDINKEEITAGAGAMMPKVAKKSIEYSLTGFEWAINIPGTIGGSVCGNAGAYNSEIFDSLVSIKAINKNLEIKYFKKDELFHKYRETNIKDLGLIVLEAKFILEKGDKLESLDLIERRCSKRRDTQPLEYPSAGSVFRNPKNDFAGRLIEEVGLKGKKIGGAEVSQKHANFIVNVGNATSNDIKNLIKLVQEEVRNNFNIDLILEQEIVEWDEA